MGVVCYDSSGKTLEWLTQWDTDKVLIIGGVDFTSAPIFYFSNTIDRYKHPVQSSLCEFGAEALIPNHLLQYEVPIIVTFELGSKTYEVRIHVFPKDIPHDYDEPIHGGSGYIPRPGTGSGTNVSVNVIDNLTTDDSKSALSAAQGVVLKELIDDLDNEKIDTSDLSDAVDMAIEKGVDDIEIIDIVRTSGDGSIGTTDIYTITYTDNTTSEFSIYNDTNGFGGTVGPDSSVVPGNDGATFTPFVDIYGNLSWSNDKGLDNPDIVNIKGNDGDDGVGIVSVVQTVKSDEDDGDNIVTITLSDGTSHAITIQNGSRGKDGETTSANVIVDEELSSTSTNPVQNKAILAAINSSVSDHNTNTYTHNDIRNLISDLTLRLNTLANSTDEDLDQMAEIVGYIKSNKTLIESITTLKINVSDIVDDLISNISNKPLSAAQGVVIKSLIESLQININKRALNADLTSHTSNQAIHLTDDDRERWNNAGSLAGTSLQTSGGDMLGSIDMNNNRVTGLPDPISNDEPITKGYAVSEFATAVEVKDLQDKVGDQSVSTQISSALENFTFGKTLKEHMQEEELILSELQYGDSLPEPTTPGRIFFLRVTS